MPSFLTNVLSGFFISHSSISKLLKQSQRSALKMYEAGIPIVMGADAGNWPLFTTLFHGVGSIFELEALVDAGIPVNEVLKSATTRAAQMLKINDKVGNVKPGMKADLLLLSENPLKNIKAFRNISYVIKSGYVRSPQEWMDQKDNIK